MAASCPHEQTCALLRITNTVPIRASILSPSVCTSIHQPFTRWNRSGRNFHRPWATTLRHRRPVRHQQRSRGPQTDPQRYQCNRKGKRPIEDGPRQSETCLSPAARTSTRQSASSIPWTFDIGYSSFRVWTHSGKLHSCKRLNNQCRTRPLTKEGSTSTWFLILDAAPLPQLPTRNPNSEIRNHSSASSFGSSTCS